MVGGVHVCALGALSSYYERCILSECLIEWSCFQIKDIEAVADMSRDPEAHEEEPKLTAGIKICNLTKIYSSVCDLHDANTYIHVYNCLYVQGFTYEIYTCMY